MAEVNESQFSALWRIGPAAQGGQGQQVLQVYEMGPVGLGRELRDVTTLGDAIHKHKLNIPDIPEIAVKLYYDPADTTHLQIWADGVAGTLPNWRIELEEGNSPTESIVFSAYVVNPQIDSFGVDQDLTLSFSLKPQTLLSEIHV